LVAAAIAAEKGGEAEIGPDMPAEDETAALPEPEADGADARHEAAAADDGAAPAPAMTPSDFEVLDPLDLLARATGFVARQLTRLMQNAERRGGRLDKAQIDGLVALSRMMDRWETLAHERAKKDEADSDAEISEAMRWINDRIVELAAGEAERVIAARQAAAERAAGAEGMAGDGAPGAISAVVDG
jgi:hypothetical protein